MIQAIPRTRHTIQLGQWQRAYLLAIQAIEHKEGIKSYPLREVTACVVRNSVDLQLFLQKQKKIVHVVGRKPMTLRNKETILTYWP